MRNYKLRSEPPCNTKTIQRHPSHPRLPSRMRKARPRTLNRRASNTCTCNFLLSVMHTAGPTRKGLKISEAACGLAARLPQLSTCTMWNWGLAARLVAAKCGTGVLPPDLHTAEGPLEVQSLIQEPWANLNSGALASRIPQRRELNRSLTHRVNTPLTRNSRTRRGGIGL